jgi:transcriptional antiterminator RfaH
MGMMWYVARTEPRGEFLSAAELTRDGYDVFLPCINEPNPKPGHTKTPLFPGYLFLKCDPTTESWPSFRSVHRIAGWVKFGNEIPCLPDNDVVDLMERLDIINQQGGMLDTYLPGDKVHVDTGTLQCLAEVVEGVKSPQARAKVLLQFMGRQVLAQVPWGSLRPLEDWPEKSQRLPRRTRGGGRWIKNSDARSLASV